MWAFFLIPFGVLVVAGALLLGWGIPFIILFGALFVALALFFALQSTAAAPTTEGEDSGQPSWMRKHWWQ